MLVMYLPRSLIGFDSVIKPRFSVCISVINYNSERLLKVALSATFKISLGFMKAQSAATEIFLV